MENVRRESKKGNIAKENLEEMATTLKRDNDRIMAWLLVMKLINYINNDEKRLQELTVEKAKNNTFLKKYHEFMDRLEHFSKKDIQYLTKFKEKIKPNP